MKKHSNPNCHCASCRSIRGDNPFLEKHLSEEHKKALALANKNHSAWNKGLTKETDKRVAKYSKSLQNRQFSDECKKKISLAKKGKPLNHKSNCSCMICKSKRGEYRGKNHPLYDISRYWQKGEKNHKWKSYDKCNLNTKHEKIAKILPKPDCCPMCERKVRLILSNVDHKYSSNPEDWWWICLTCHSYFDGVPFINSEIRKQDWSSPEYRLKQDIAQKKRWSKK